MLDVGVAEPKLQPPGVVARIGQQMAAGVAQLVRMAVRQPCPVTCGFDHFGDVATGHRPATLCREHEGGFRFLLAPKLAQGPQFIALDRVNGMDTTFEPPHVQMALGEIHLISANR